MWISESPDYYKPELAQLLYPVFTHLYIRLLVSSPATPGAAAAHRFHKRHLSTFQVYVISNDPPCKNGSARSTTVPLKPLSDQ